MSKGLITMSHQELDRLTIIESVINKKITQKVAAQRLNLTVRHIKRLVKSYRTQGTHGLISKRRGQPSNNKISETVRSQAIHLIRNHYHDFSPTFAHEKLTEDHGLSFSVETLRNWMIDEGIWESKTKRAIKVHQTRTRRSCFGELIQVDGSPHDWFEGRAPKGNPPLKTNSLKVEFSRIITQEEIYYEKIKIYR